MKPFIKKTLFLLIPIILAIFAMDIWLRNMNTLYKEKYSGAIKAKDSIEILILGNSHSNYGVDPTEFSMYAYNIANVSQSLYFDIRITESLSGSLPKLKYVFISIDFHSLYFSSQGLYDYWSYYGNGIKYKDKSYLACEISPFFFGYTPIVAKAKLKRKLLYLFSGKKNIINFEVETGVNITDTIKHGFISFEKPDYSLHNISEYQKTATRFNNTVKSKEHKEVFEDLSGFIERLKQKKICPILFSPATYSEYNDLLDKNTIKQNHDYIEILKKKFGIEYWQFYNDPDFVKEDFYNCDHLNKKGAKKLAKKMNDKLTSYISATSK